MCAGNAGVPAITPIQTLPAGSQVLLMPDKTKTSVKDGAMTAMVVGNVMCPVELQEDIGGVQQGGPFDHQLHHSATQILRYGCQYLF